MNIVARHFRLQKAGNSFEECEDRFFSRYLNRDLEREKSPSGAEVFLAIADGATEGMFSGTWAEILVKTYCRSGEKGADSHTFLRKAFQNWDSWIQNYLNKRERSNKPIKWFEEPGIRAGAFSTFLGVRLVGDNQHIPGRWRAFAVGDSCLFQVRNDRMILAFPLERSENFSSCPFLISTNAAVRDRLSETCRSGEGNFLIGDRFLLMTDALACWFLQEHEADNRPWTTLAGIGDDDATDFQKLIDRLRNDKKIRNDDVTLVCVEITD